MYNLDVSGKLHPNYFAPDCCQIVQAATAFTRETLMEALMEALMEVIEGLPPKTALP
jgi:hypothetical protein